MEQIRQQYFRVLFPLLLVALPFSKAVASVAEVALLVLSLAFFFRELTIYNIRRSAPVWVITALFLIYSLGLLWTTDIAAGLKFLNIQHSILLMPLIIFLNRREISGRWLHYANYFIAATALAAGITLLLNLLPDASLTALTGKMTFLEPYEARLDKEAFGLYCPFHNKIQFNNLLCLATLVGIYSFVQSRKKLLLLPLTILVIGILMLGGRGGQLGLLAGLMVWVTAVAINKILPHLQQSIGRAGGLAIIIGVMLVVTVVTPIVIFKTVPAVNKRYHQLFWEMGTISDNTYMHYDYSHFTSLRRMVSWQNMWTVAKHNPMLGVGTGDYPAALKEVYEKDNIDLPVNNHSQYLQIWASVGLLGLAVFLGAIGYWLVSLRNGSPAYHLALAFMIFYLLSMIPDAVLLRQVDNMCFPLFMGIIACINLKEKQAEWPAYRQ